MFKTTAHIGCVILVYGQLNFICYVIIYWVYTFLYNNFFQIAEKEYFKSLQRIEYTYKEMTHEMKDEKYRMKETKLIDWCIKKILVFQQRNRE